MPLRGNFGKKGKVNSEFFYRVREDTMEDSVHFGL